MAGKFDPQERAVFVQEFGAAWPIVLHDMIEFVELTHLSIGHGRPGVVTVRIARERVAPNDLQPHVRRFLDRISRQIPGMRVVVKAEHHPAHRIEIRYSHAA